MTQTLKEQAVKGTAWSAIERFSSQGVSFLIQLVLARLLMPEDYGVIAMLAIFLQIAQVFIDCGFANALIKKLDCTEADYSTVFYYNLAVSVGIFILFFFTSPLVASFYEVPILTNVMRVISLTLIINALCIVQRTKLVKQIDFKTQTKVSILSVIISGGVGILFAYKGFGVWALCVQSILYSLAQFVFLLIYVRWKPQLIFSRDSFHEMFNYGSKILGAGLISVIYNNLYTIVIGKRFESESLGYYSRAEHFVKFPSTNIGSIVARVSLPVISKIQDDNEKLVVVYRKIIKYSSFIIFPLMLGLCAVAKPFIVVLLSEKWIGAVVILQILCLEYMVDHLSVLNLNLLYVKGRTDLVLKLEIIKKTIAVAILLCSIPFGITIMCWGRVLYSVIAVFINSYYTNKLINLSVWRQLLDIFPYFLVSSVMAVVVFMSSLMFSSYAAQLVIGILIGIMLYFIATLLFFKFEVNDVLSALKRNKQ